MTLEVDGNALGIVPAIAGHPDMRRHGVESMDLQQALIQHNRLPVQHLDSDVRASSRV
jgi:hypothetical protein